MKTKFSLILIAVVFGLMALLPKTQAVNPPPDGCYPNYTTAEGCNAISQLGIGVGNTGIGWYSLSVVDDSSYNTGVGAGTLAVNIGQSNTATGAGAMLLNTTGTSNVANGTDALLYNDSGSWNNAVGTFALFGNVDGDNNNAFGNAALLQNIHAHHNTAMGDMALLTNDISGNGMANSNTAVGASALFHNADGSQNTAVGAGALFSNTNAMNNTAIGLSALGSTTGQGNIGIGAFAGNNLTTGDFNIDIFSPGLGGDDRTIRIGTATQTATYIAGISGAMVPGGVTVIVDAMGHLGTVVSSQRFKDQIKPMDKASEAIFALKPVTFRYKKELDPDGISQFGLVAEQVEKVDPDLVARDAQGKVYTVRYEAVNAMLLNEFLKEHHKVEEQQTAIAELKSMLAQQRNEFRAAMDEQRKEMATVRARLNQQDTKIQTVNDRIELPKSSSQVFAHNE